VLVQLRQKWAALPRWARWILVLYIAGFADGTADHARWMIHGGIHAYASSYPLVPYQLFFVSLILLDPLVIALATLVRREAIWLACGVMVADIAANWAGNWARIQDYPTRLAENVPWLITVFGVFVFVTAFPLLRVMTGPALPGQHEAASSHRQTGLDR